MKNSGKLIHFNRIFKISFVKKRRSVSKIFRNFEICYLQSTDFALLIRIQEVFDKLITNWILKSHKVFQS